MYITSAIKLRPLFVLAALATAALLAACGSSSSTSSTAKASSSSSSASASTGTAGTNRSKLVACLKQHGVTLPNGGARPGGAGGPPGGGGPYGGAGGLFGGGRPGGGGLGALRNNPKAAAAFKACGGGSFRGSGTNFLARRQALVNSFVSCVASHGFKLPKPNLSGNGQPVFPKSLQSNKQFIAAATPCQGLLRPAAGSGPPGGAGAPPGGSTGA